MKHFNIINDRKLYLKIINFKKLSDQEKDAVRQELLNRDIKDPDALIKSYSNPINLKGLIIGFIMLILGLIPLLLLGFEGLENTDWLKYLSIISLFVGFSIIGMYINDKIRK